MKLIFLKEESTSPSAEYLEQLEPGNTKYACRNAYDYINQMYRREPEYFPKKRNSQDEAEKN